LGSFNQYKQGQGGDVAHWLEVHRAGSVLVDRKTGDKTTMHVPRAAVCIAGGIQPQTLRRCLTPEFFENGLAARLLTSMPPKRLKKWREADVNEQTLQSMTNLYDELLRLEPATDSDGDPEPADIELDHNAKAAWIGFYNEHAREQAEHDAELSAVWSKLEGYAARLALLVHCIRQVTTRDVDPWRVDEQSIAAGIALAHWFGHEATRVYATLSESQDESKHRELARWIERRGGRVTVRDLTHGLRRYRGKPQLAEAELERLSQAGIGRWQEPKTNSAGGRPQRVFHLLTHVANSSAAADTSVTVTKTPAYRAAPEGFGDGDGVVGDGSMAHGSADVEEADEREPAALQEVGM
jgi:hypothetical protein